MAETMQPSRGLSGGQWTWRNRLRCWFRGHVVPPGAPQFSGENVECWFCVRCNAQALFRDSRSGWYFETWDEMADAVIHTWRIKTVDELFGFGTPLSVQGRFPEGEK